MEESTYNPCLFYRSSLFGIMEIKTNDILILADNNFANKEEAQIKAIKIMTKNQEHFTPTQPLKFNRAQIKLDSEGIVLTKKSHIDGIFLVIDHNTDSTSLGKITKKKFLSKEQYLAQRARGAYIASVCQPKASFNLFRASQIVEF